MASTANEFSPALVAEMRASLTDCEWRDEDAESIMAMPDAMVVRAIARHFDGGIAGFVLAVGGVA